MYDLFISYRRDGGYELARLLYTSFKEAGLNPFFDVEELRSGPFDEKLYTYIEESENFVLVCSPGCLDRCSNEGDWVKLEIEKAINSKKNIVPVMMKNFVFPDSLPEEIEPLRMFNGASINQEYFNASIEKIISLLVNVKPRKTAKIGKEEKQHIEELYHHAMELLGQQSFVQATACFEEIRDIHPGYVRAYWGQLLAMYRCMSNSELMLNTSEDFNDNPLLSSALAMAGESDYQIYNDVVVRRTKNCLAKAKKSFKSAEYDNAIKYAKLVLQKEPANEEMWWIRFLAENRVQDEKELFELCMGVGIKYDNSSTYKSLMEIASDKKKEEMIKFEERVKAEMANRKINQEINDCKEFIESKLAKLNNTNKSIKTNISKQLKEQRNDIYKIAAEKGKFYNNNFFSFLISMFLIAVAYLIVNAVLLFAKVEGSSPLIVAGVFGGILLLTLIIKIKKSLKAMKSSTKSINAFNGLCENINKLEKEYNRNEKIKNDIQEVFDQFIENLDLDKEGVKLVKEKVRELAKE